MKKQAKPKIGRPLKFNEPTVMIHFRVPASKKEEIRRDINKLLKKYIS